MSNPITDIRTQMKAIITSLTTPDYQANWGSADEWDEVRQTLPAAYIKFPREDNADPFEANAKEFANELTVEIHIFDKLPAESSKPVESHEDLLLDRLVDIKKAFNQYENATVNNTCDHIRYLGYQITTPDSNDRLQANKLVTNWTVLYRQDGLEPKNKR